MIQRSNPESSPMKIIRKATEAVIIFLFAVLVAVVFYQVLARYVLNSPPSWSEELARYCQVWIILLASSICIRKGSHLAVDYFSHRFSPRARKFADTAKSLLIVFYVSIVLVYGWRLMVVGKYQLSPALQVKMSYVYIIFPLSGTLMLVEAVLKTAEIIRTPWTEKDKLSDKNLE
jgi:TRAP-type C4-dicarboxylate transport system permease small subunit